MSIFSDVQIRVPKSNTFDLSNDKKLSFNVGKLTPVLLLELVPGDKITINTASLVRMMPMVAPLMHRFDVYIHNFFVPNRLVWSNWEDFITGGVDGEDTSVAPFMDLASVADGSLSDYLGLPTFSAGTDDLRVSAIPYAGYQMIFNEYYKDQNLVTVTIPDTLTDGDNSSQASMLNIRNRSWRKDYFTSALPWTQRGPEATIPLGTTAPLNFSPVLPAQWYGSGTTPSAGRHSIEGNYPGGSNVGTAEVDLGAGSYGNVTLDNSDSLTVDLSSATAATINELRNAFRLQEFLEKNARGGSRYTENILSHFGVKSSDARLNRPEFLGGFRTPIQISEVLQTSETPASGTPQGNMAGHGISVGGNKAISYFAEEHGYIFSILSVLPQPAYQQGVPKHWNRFDKLDYYWPSFAHLGEQPILNREIYWDPNDGLNDDVFGYTPRYAEMKYMPSTVHGQFRSSLDFWHAGRIFSSRPALNSTFVSAVSTEVDRIFSVTDPSEDKLWAHVHHTIKARRRMPYFGTPSF